MALVWYLKHSLEKTFLILFLLQLLVRQFYQWLTTVHYYVCYYPLQHVSSGQDMQPTATITTTLPQRPLVIAKMVNPALPIPITREMFAGKDS